MSIIISSFAALISLIALLHSFFSHRLTLEQNVSSLIFTSKIALDSKLVNNSIDEIRTLKPLIEDYLNSLNYACSLYKGLKINRKRFRNLYKNDILNLHKYNSYSQVLKDNSDSFTYIFLVIGMLSKE